MAAPETGFVFLDFDRGAINFQVVGDALQYAGNNIFLARQRPFYFYFNRETLTAKLEPLLFFPGRVLSHEHGRFVDTQGLSHIFIKFDSTPAECEVVRF